MNARKKRDVAWGFFSTYGGERTMWWSMTKTKKEMERTRRAHWFAKMSPTKVFRITPPKPKTKRGRAEVVLRRAKMVLYSETRRVWVPDAGTYDWIVSIKQRERRWQDERAGT